ncbi:hypothetical protein D3C80_2133280 [compost metagenome]
MFCRCAAGKKIPGNAGETVGEQQWANPVVVKMGYRLQQRSNKGESHEMAGDQQDCHQESCKKLWVCQLFGELP